MSDETPPTKPKPKRVAIEVKLDPEQVAGTYVNMARIFHNQTEFVMDGLFLPPQSKTAHVQARFVFSPIHAKFLHAALGQNIRLYEQKFGPISTSGSGNDPGQILH
jgi:hypothetical protein